MGAYKSATAPESLQRVKVYRLNDEGKWDDQGTGHVTVDYVEETEDVGLVVLDEEDSDPLLIHRICSEDIYRKQEDTIISWRDPEIATELALSFQESAGCTFIWDQIITAQRNLESKAPNDKTSYDRSGLKELPAIELSTLPSLLKIVTESERADQMRLTELLLNDQEIFKKLMDLFRICEDLDNKDALHIIYKIVKGTISLNNSQILEKLFGDDLLMDIIGCLEYDPEVKSAQHHREFLKNHVVFKEAIPIKNPVVLSKIHQTYRIRYLKDVVLPKVLDEATVSNLNSIIQSNNVIVVSFLKDDSSFIKELFARLISSTTSAESKRNLVFFLHEFCNLSKSLQGVQKNRLFRDLTNEGIFDAVTTALRSEEKRLVLAGTDILLIFQNHDPNLLRNYVIQQEGNLLLGLLVEGLVADFGGDMNCQFLEIICCLLDTYTLPATQRDTIVDIFYEKHLSLLVGVIISSCPFGATPEILSGICDLLCYCVLQHPYRIKCNFLANNLVEGVLFLTQRRERYLVVSAVRFVRTILSRPDEHLIYHFIDNNILKPVVEAFVANGDRYNLLNSAVLDLFEYIRKENLQLLLRYIVESFWNQLVRFESLACIHSFKIKYDQISEDIDRRTNSNIKDSQNSPDEGTLDKDEEKNFSGNSDGEDARSASHSNKKLAQMSPVNDGVAGHPSTSSKSAILVDYDDDDDDEDYQPPRKKHSKAFKGDGCVVKTPNSKRKMLTTDKESELTKKQDCEDIVASPLCSAVSQAELLNEETLDRAKAVSYSGEANERSTDGRRCEEGSGSDESYFDNEKSVGCGNSDREPIKENSTRSDELDNYKSLRNENPDDKEPACQESYFSKQMYVRSDEEQHGEDPSILISEQSCEEETGKKDLLNTGRYLVDKSSDIKNTQGAKPNDQKDCLVDRNLVEENQKSEPYDDKKSDDEDCPVKSEKPSPELSRNGS
ncbi:unnamed protein product [Rhodiola kirilowii]